MRRLWRQKQYCNFLEPTFGVFQKTPILQGASKDVRYRNCNFLHGFTDILNITDKSISYSFLDKGAEGARGRGLCQPKPPPCATGGTDRAGEAGPHRVRSYSALCCTRLYTKCLLKCFWGI
jgi:hypothetical protein